MEAEYGGGTRLTKRWVHGELHDSLPPMSSHLLVAHYGTGAAEAVWRTDGRRLSSRMRAGALTLIPVGQDGRWDTFGSVEVSQVYLPDSRLQAAADALAGGRRVELIGRAAFADPVAGRIMDILSRDDPTGDPSGRLFTEQAIDLLCTQLIRGHSTCGAIAPAEPRCGLADWQVKKVAGYVRDNLSEEVTLDMLAGLLSLSRFHFATAFRLATGRTPHEWLVAERIERARELLRDPRMPVTEVALSVGYQTPSSFSAAFRKAVGATPREFRGGL
jgi:AraC family transcriptional regulator